MHISTIKRVFKCQSKFWKSLKFGFNVALWNYLFDVQPTLKVANKKISTLTNFAEKEFRDVIEKYKAEKDNIVLQNYTDKIPVWIFWFQGKDSRPELVKICNDSVEKFLPKDIVEIYYLSEENYRDYVDIPEYVIEKHKKGKITIAAFSDILRYSLLAKHGGFWLDSTILLTEEIDESFLQADLFTLRIFDENLYLKEPSRAIWNNFIWLSKPNNILFLFARDCLLKYWKNQNSIVDYILPDYIIILARKYFPYVKDLMDSIQPNIKDIYLTWSSLNKEYSDDLWNKIIENSPIHKLAYKQQYKDFIEENKLTIYGHIKKILDY